jgi:hypothetical protein
MGLDGLGILRIDSNLYGDAVERGRPRNSITCIHREM